MRKKLKWWLLGIALLMAVQLLSALSFKSLGIVGSDTSHEKTLDLIQSPKLLFITIIVAPLLEEFIFRFLLYRKNLKNPYGILTALVSSILFGFVHGQPFLMTVPIILNGLIYCLIYKRSGSIWISILTHASYNTIVFIIISLTLK